MKILTIDSHPLISNGLKLTLFKLSNNIQYFAASHCQEAEHIINQQQGVDLVLLDISLPDMNNFISLKRIAEQLSTTPIIILSSESLADIKRTMEGLIQSYIPKSYNNDSMLATIWLVLTGGRFNPLISENYTLVEEVGLSEAIKLTRRQKQILALLVQGKSNKLMAKELNIALNTVNIHVSAVFKILDVNNRTEAAFLANNLNLLSV